MSKVQYCPECGTKDFYFSPISGNDCVNPKCKHYNGSKVLSKKEEAFKSKRDDTTKKLFKTEGNATNVLFNSDDFADPNRNLLNGNSFEDITDEEVEEIFVKTFRGTFKGFQKDFTSDDDDYEEVDLIDFIMNTKVCEL